MYLRRALMALFAVCVAGVLSPWPRHAQSTELQIDIADDGCGFDVQATRQTAQGKGLNSLDKRARMLGAQLEVVSSPPGTRSTLRVPQA